MANTINKPARSVCGKKFEQNETKNSEGYQKSCQAGRKPNKQAHGAGSNCLIAQQVVRLAEQTKKANAKYNNKAYAEITVNNV